MFYITDSTEYDTCSPTTRAVGNNRKQCFLSGILRDPFSKNGRDPRDPISNFGRDPRDPILQNNSGIPGSFTQKRPKFFRPAAGLYKSFFYHNFLRDPRDPFSNIGRDPRDPFTYFGLGSPESFWTSSVEGSRDPGVILKNRIPGIPAKI